MRALIIEAITQTRAVGRLGRLEAIANTPGFRRHLAARFAAWTRSETAARRRSPADADPAEWAIFLRYRSLLRNTLKAEDAPGFALWAAAHLAAHPRLLIAPETHVVVFDPPEPGPAVERALGALHQEAECFDLFLPFEPNLNPITGEVARLRARLLDMGFTEHAVPPPGDRPPALRVLEQEWSIGLAGLSSRATDSTGLKVLGAPLGEGLGTVVASQVRGLVGQGVPLDEIVLLVPRWDQQAAVILERLTAWGIPTAPMSPTPLVSDPAVRALLLAAGIPAEDWEADRLISLLRNTLIRPDWPEVAIPDDLTLTASQLRKLRVFRDRDAILASLERSIATASREASNLSPEASQQAAIETSLKVLRRLAKLFDGVEQPAPWWVGVDRLARLAEALQLRSPALEALELALDEQGYVLEKLNRADEALRWPDFIREVRSVATELFIPVPPPGGVALRVLTVDEVRGSRVRHVLLANLAEGTFPARELIERGLESDADGEAEAYYQQELVRFLRVLDSAGEQLTLIYPSTDEKGHELLVAGFLDEIRRRFETGRLDETEIRRAEQLLRRPEHCGTAHESRIRAVALAAGHLASASGDDPFRELRACAADPRHRPVLESVAASLRLSLIRSPASRVFSPYEGRLTHPRAVARLAEIFGPNRPVFSASQLESLAVCPFQYFQKYVLFLEPVDELDELEVNPIKRGHLFHRALEELHTQLRDTAADGQDSMPERVALGIVACVNRLIEEQDLRGRSRVERGLHAIESERLRRMARRYASQFQRYHQLNEGRAACLHCEVAFGKPAQSGYPALQIGPPENGIQLQGVIDRIDLILHEDRVLFRVIDYKTGATPRRSKVGQGVALQLPLYALAAERIILADRNGLPLDAGYWDLRGRGFRATTEVVELARLDEEAVERWRADCDRLETYILKLVDRLRGAEFVVRPTIKDCTRTCDYKTVCRISQVRRAEKTTPAAPTLEAAP